MQKIIAKFEVPYLQILDEKGNCDEKILKETKLQGADIKKIYEFMILAKTFDDYALKLQREGRIGTYASGRGEEASHVASAFALEKNDWIFPSFRENAALITRGISLEALYSYWGGDEKGMQEKINVFPICIPVATQIPHAVGFAFASKIKKENLVTCVYFGDGATSKGDFHEALNFAGVFKLPCIFLCINNQYAISMPRSKQTASQTIAQKAISYGFQGIQIDGNDVFAVYKATQDALKKARDGVPTLIECFTYRLEHHTTADDATRYRSQKEVEEWKKKDPITRLELFMKKKNILTDIQKKKVQDDSKKKVEDAVKKYSSMPPPSPEDMFKYTYKNMTWNLKEQLAELKESF